MHLKNTIKYCDIDNETALRFLKENKALKESVTITKSDHWVGAFDVSKLIGVIGIINFSKTKRIKSFYVNSEYRKNGIGNNLIKSVLDNNKITAFATSKSQNLFIKNGFKIKSIIKNIYFMERKENEITSL